jgi:hypothetical protein
LDGWAEWLHGPCSQLRLCWIDTRQAAKM